MQLLNRLANTFTSKHIVPLRSPMIHGKYNSVHSWCDKLKSQIKQSSHGLSRKLAPYTPVAEVENLRQWVRENPVAKIYLQGGLDQIPHYVHEKVTNEDGSITVLPPRKGINSGINYNDLLDQFAEITRTPPAFSDHDIVGIPFYSLVIDLLNTDFGRTFFALTEVNDLLRPIYNKYAEMLDSPYSLKHVNNAHDGWLSPKALERVCYKDFICDTSKPHYGFKSWHDWFTREIREQARKFEPLAQNEILNNSEHYPNFKMPYIDAKWEDSFWLKDQHYSLAEMFGTATMSQQDAQYFKDHFDNGTVYQGFLNPWCYHRWRSPVSGIIEKNFKIGNSYYTGNPSLPNNLSASFIASQPLFTMTSVRQIYVIKADNPKIGRIAVFEIGMAEVSGIHNEIIGQGKRIEKGDLLGWFRYGGSSHCLVFDNKVDNLQFAQGIFERDQKGHSIKQNVRTVLATVGDQLKNKKKKKKEEKY